MKISCHIIQDILPLYIEGMVSEDTKVMVEDHIRDCHECSDLLANMKDSEINIIDDDRSILSKVNKRIQKKNRQVFVVSLALALIIFILAISFLTSPEYIPYSNSSVSIEEVGDKRLMVIFSQDVYGYDINKYLSEDRSGYEYHLTTWNSIWNRKIKKSNINNTILNPDGEKVNAVYYYSVDGQVDRLIYGKSPYENGGVMTLPRLFLGYYFVLALGMTGLLATITFLFRKNREVTRIMVRLLFIPMSYVIGNLLLKGLKTSSYNATRDFYGILLLTIPIYIGMVEVYKKINKKRYD